MAFSFAQGGPPPAFFKERRYNVLCTGEIDLHSMSKARNTLHDFLSRQGTWAVHTITLSTDVVPMAGP